MDWHQVSGDRQRGAVLECLDVISGNTAMKDWTGVLFFSSRSWRRYERQGWEWSRWNSRWTSKEPRQHGEPWRKCRKRPWAAWRAQPGEPGSRFPALLPRASDTRVHEPTVTDEPTWALSAWTLTGLFSEPSNAVNKFYQWCSDGAIHSGTWL